MNRPVYDTIAAEYKNSKDLPFRKYIEEFTLFRLTGNLRGKHLLDLACGKEFQFDNYHLHLETFSEVFAEAGFKDFQWVGPFFHPSQKHHSFWNDFMNNPPMIGFIACKDY